MIADFFKFLCRKITPSIFVASILFAQASLADDRVIVFSTVAGMHETAFVLAKVVLEAIGKEAELNVELRRFPAKRSVTNLRDGVADAEISRILSFSKIYPEGIRVAEPITLSSYFAYSNKPIEVNGWDSLKQYRIVTVRGFRFVDEYLPDHDTYAVSSFEMALHFVSAGRADLLIGARLSIDPLLQLDEFKASGIKMVKPAIAQLELFTFFRPELIKEAAAYEKALVKLKDNGTLSEIIGTFSNLPDGI